MSSINNITLHFIDKWRQLIFLCLKFLHGFSAFYIIYLGMEGSAFSHPAESIMGMFIMSLGEFGDFYDTFKETRHHTLAIVGVFIVCFVLYSDLISD